MRNVKTLSLILIIGPILFLWVWGAIYYLIAGLDPLISRPWSIPLTLLEFHHIDSIRIKVILVGVILFIVTATCILVFLKERLSNNLGDAKFANNADIKRAGLRSKKGLVLGKFKGKYLMDNGQTHVLVAAPTGSGKGVGIVIPNLLNWNDSAVVLDIKGENYTLTSGFRQLHGHRIFVFSPFAEHSHRFNPFDTINLDPRNRFNDIQNIANILLPDNDKDPTWSQQGRALFVAFALYLLDHPTQDCTIGNILRYLQTQDDTRDVVKAIIQAEGDKLDAAAQRVFSNLAQQEKRMSESVKVGLVGALSLWNSPSIDAATSATDFDIMELRKKKTTIYVVVSLADLTSLRPLLTLFFEQTFMSQLRKEPGKDDIYKLLFLLDEFESLGTMNGIVDKLPFVRSFGIRIMAIIQGLSQLDQRYGAAGRDKILQGSKHQIFFASNDQQTTNYVSQTLGKTTIQTMSKSRSRQGRTLSRQSQSRDLLLPQEVREMSPDKCIVVTEGTRAIMGKKIRYFKDAAMKSRVKHEKAKVPALNLEPKFSPSLEEIVGEKIAQEIRSAKGGHQAGAKKPQQNPVKESQPSQSFNDILSKLNQAPSPKTE